MKVWITTSSASGDRKSLFDRQRSTSSSYHPDRDCPRLKPVDDERITDSTKSREEWRGKTMCDFCAKDVKNAERRHDNCPLCEDPIHNNLASHLQECSQA